MNFQPHFLNHEYPLLVILFTKVYVLTPFINLCEQNSKLLDN